MGSLQKPPRSRAPTPDDGPELTALARLAGSGDPAAVRRFLETVRPTLARVVTRILGARHPDVDDVIQQSLIAVVQALGAFRGECHPLGYASRIAFRVALLARRTASQRRERQEALALLSASESDAIWPGQETASERQKRAWRDLLGELPGEQAEAFGLRVALGWSLDEVAQATSAPVNTVRSRIRLAKEALRRRIEADPTLIDALEFP